MMKWRVRRRSSCQSLTPEVVKSLEFLDKVLAQYDDPESNYSSLPYDSHSCPNFIFGSDDGSVLDNTQSDSIQSKDSGLMMSFDHSEEKLFENKSLIATQCDNETSVLNQDKSQTKNIRPPIPKRSSTTRLSTCFENITHQSDKQKIGETTEPLSADTSDEKPKFMYKNESVKQAEQSVENQITASKIAPKDSAKCSVDKTASQIKNRLESVHIESRGASSDNLRLLTADCSKKIVHINNCMKMKSYKHSRSASDGSIVMCHGQTSFMSIPEKQCSFDHLLELKNKFSRIKYLLKNNMIKGLDEKPPSFKPPPPPLSYSKSQSTPVGPVHSTPVTIPKHKRSIKMKESTLQDSNRLNQINATNQSVKTENNINPKLQELPTITKVSKSIPIVTNEACEIICAASSETVSSIKQHQRPILDFQVSLEDSFAEIKTIPQDASGEFQGKNHLTVQEQRPHMSTFLGTKCNSPRTGSLKYRNSSLSPVREKIPSSSNTSGGKYRKSSLSSLIERDFCGTPKANTLPSGITQRDSNFSSLREKLSSIIPKAGTLPSSMKQSSSACQTEECEKKWNWKRVKTKKQSKKDREGGATEGKPTEPGAVKSGERSRPWKGLWK